MENYFNNEMINLIDSELSSINIDINIDLINRIKKDYENNLSDFFISRYKIRQRTGSDKILLLDDKKITEYIENNFIIKKSDNSCNIISYNNTNLIDNAKFISEQGKAEIKKKLNFNLKLEWNIGSIYGIYNIFFKNIDDILNFLDKIKILIKITYFIFDKLSNNKNNNKVICYFYLTDLKKTINWESKETIGINNVNTGMTSRSLIKLDQCNNDEYILLWRKEELIKVYIHELIHYFDIDTNNYYDIKKLTNKICVVNSIQTIPNEAYTDFLTIIINSIIFSTYSNNNNIEVIIKNEIKFSLFQAAKILYYYGFTKWEDFNTTDCNNYFDQGSSVFSYYIIKSILLYYFNDTISILKEMNNNETYYLNFKTNKINIKIFKDHIIKSFYKKDFSQELNKILDSFNNINIRSNIYKSLKMSIYSL